MFHESPAATADMTALPGVLGCRILRRTIKVRLGSNPLRWPGGTTLSAISRREFLKHQGLSAKKSNLLRLLISVFSKLTAAS